MQFRAISLCASVCMHAYSLNCHWESLLFSSNAEAPHTANKCLVLHRLTNTAQNADVELLRLVVFVQLIGLNTETYAEWEEGALIGCALCAAY